MAKFFKDRLTKPSIEQPLFAYWKLKSKESENEEYFRAFYFPIRRLAGLFLALSTLVHDYPGSIGTILELLLL